MSALGHYNRTLTLALVLLSLGARLAMLQGNLWRLREGPHDVDNYMQLAANIANWGTFGSYDIPTAHRPPLYPLLFAPLYWLESHLGLAWGWQVTAAGILHLVFGALTSALTFRLAQRWGLERWSLLAGALVALDPLLLHWVRRPMTETLAALLVTTALYLLSTSDRRSESWLSYAAGLILGLGMLCRTTLWAFALLAVLQGGFARGRDGRRNLQWSAVVLCVALVVQVPWLLRNWLAFRRPILTTTHGGYTLLLGNNDSYYNDIIHGSPLRAWSGSDLERWQTETNIRAALDGVKTEFERDAYNYRMARATIAARPGDFLVGVVIRFLSLWRVTPHASGEYSSTIRIGCAIFYIPELLLMFVGLYDRRVWQWPLVLLPASLISFTAVHSVYWSDMRMRAPIVPAIAILAALGCQTISGKVRDTRLRGAHSKG